MVCYACHTLITKIGEQNYETKLMRFITSFFGVEEEKKVLANQPESIVEHADITVRVPQRILLGTISC